MNTVFILIGLTLGLGLGLVASITEAPALLHAAQAVEPIGQAFLRAIQMVVIPLVASVVFVGVGRIGSLHKLARLGSLTMALWGVMTPLAILIGMGTIYVTLPFIASIPLPIGDINLNTTTWGVVDFFINLVPKNPIQVAAEGSLLPLLTFIFLLAAATTTLPADKQQRLTEPIEALGEALIKLMTWILWTAPVGVFALAAPVVAQTGWSMLQNLAIFIFAVIVGLFVLKGFLFLPLVWIFGKVRPTKFVQATMGSYTMAFTTTTSVGTLPMMLHEAEKMGLSKSRFSLTLPLAASLNRPGSALFQSASFVFLATLYEIPLDIGLILTLVLTVFLISMTVAPVPSASIASMIPVLSVVGIPIEGLGILLGVDRIPDVFRTATNVTGHMSTATIVDAMTQQKAHKKKGMTHTR